MKKLLMVLMLMLFLVGCGEKPDENHSDWYNGLKGSNKVQAYSEKMINEKSTTSIFNNTENVSLAYSLGEIFKIWMLSEGVVDEELKDLNKFAETFDAKYVDKEKRIVFEYKSRKHYSGYIEGSIDSNGAFIPKNIYLYNPLSPAHDENNAVDMEKKYSDVAMTLTTNQEIYTMMINDGNITPLENTKKEDKKATEKSTQISAYDKHNNYSIKIKAEGLKDKADLFFDETEDYAPYLGVYTPHPNNPNDFQDVEYINLINSWSIEKTGQVGFANLFKLKGDKVYPLDFGEGDFGVAFLVEDEDGVYPVVVRYGNKHNMGNAVGANFLYPDLDVVKFQDKSGEEFLLPSEYLIKSISTKNKILTINYGNGSTEKYEVSNLSEYYYVLKEVK
jgi:lipoprotein